MIHLQVDPALQDPPDLPALEQAARATLEYQAAAPGDLTIVLAGDDRLRELNREFLGLDAPTDVLAFPSGEPDPETGRMYLGDVILSVPRARAQARTAGHELPAELTLLVVHGVLHLLGHDHATPQQKAGMWAAQSAILAGLGYSGLSLPE